MHEDSPARLEGVGWHLPTARPRVRLDLSRVRPKPLRDTPLYDAGVDRGDRIVEVDGVAPTSSEVLDAVLAARSPGDTVPVRYESRGEGFEVEVELVARPTLQGRWVPDDEAGADVTAFRADWR